MSHWLDKVISLLLAPTSDLRELAIMAGGDPETFYLGVDIETIDFTNQNVEGMHFSTPVSSRPQSIGDELERLQALEELNKALLHARDDALRGRFSAEVSNATKTMFVANTSHMMRTPLNSILGYLELLENTRVAGKQLDYIGAIRQASSELLRLADDVVDVSKIESGRIELEISRVSISKLVETAVEQFRPWLSGTKVRLSIQLASDLPELIELDARRLKQVLTILLENAVKFTEAGEIRVKVGLEENKTPRRLCFEVSDTGSGMYPSKLEAILRPILTDNRYDANSWNAPGLGIPIARGIIELMGGTLSAESADGKGTRFWFILPV